MLSTLLPVLLGLSLPFAGDTLTAEAMAADTTATARPLPDDAFLDAGAEALLRSVRDGAARAEREIHAYRVEGRERVSVHARTAGRERLLFRMESAARIDWRRGEVAEVEPLGARMITPMRGERPRAVPNVTRGLVFDPAASQQVLRVPWSSESLPHPLGDLAEHHYRYESGETSDIRLSAGRVVRVRELRVHPRRAEFELVRGSFWIDIDQGAVVRAVMRPARPLTVSVGGGVERDEEGDRTASVRVESRGGSRELPFGISPTAEIRTITLEADLWQDRWWLPRLFVAEGSASAAGFVTVPVRWERVYGIYEVEGSPVGIAIDDVDEAEEEGDFEERRERCREAVEESDDLACQCWFARCMVVRTVGVTDTLALVDSPALPRSIFDEGETLLTEGEWRAVEDAVRALPPVGGLVGIDVSLITPRDDLSLLRYNRVEGLSGGLAVRARALDTEATLTGRIGTAHSRPSVALGVSRELHAIALRGRVSHELADTDRAGRGLMLGNSLNAFLFGRDDGEYYRRTGGIVSIAPPIAHRQRWEGRIFAERQRPVERRTGFSLANWDGEGFRPVVAAAPAEQVGAGLTLRGVHALGRTVRVNTVARVDGEVGSFDFARGALEMEARGPLFGWASWSLHGAGGSSLGNVPPQRWWFLGGPHTLRGYPGSVAGGDAFTRARAEVARGLPAARVAVFGDAGWAGERENLFESPPLLSVGTGASFLDGMVRLDVARAIRSPTGWRVDFYLDGAL